MMENTICKVIISYSCHIISQSVMKIELSYGNMLEIQNIYAYWMRMGHMGRTLKTKVNFIQNWFWHFEKTVIMII